MHMQDFEDSAHYGASSQEGGWLDVPKWLIHSKWIGSTGAVSVALLGGVGTR